MNNITFLSKLVGNDFSEGFYKDYSRFKHGSKKIAKQLSEDLSESIVNFKENGNYMFYSAPYNNVPTASNSLKDYFLCYITRELFEKNVKIKQGKISRNHFNYSDYGSMSAEQRREVISSESFTIDVSNLNDEDTIVLIDDIRITGAHESRLIELLKRENIKNDVIFLYHTIYNGGDPTIETRLNHHSIKNLDDINDIIENDGFVFNTRVIKFILCSDREEFLNFIDKRTLDFKEKLFKYSIINNYIDSEKYKDNILILSDILR